MIWLWSRANKTHLAFKPTVWNQRVYFHDDVMPLCTPPKQTERSGAGRRHSIRLCEVWLRSELTWIVVDFQIEIGIVMGCFTRFEDDGYRNWIKTQMGLQSLKLLLQEFIENETETFHTFLLHRVKGTKCQKRCESKKGKLNQVIDWQIIVGYLMIYWMIIQLTPKGLLFKWTRHYISSP